MKLGIMQPYFFPYLGYFSLIKHTEKWILFDPVQYIRHGWINRNRVLKPVEGWQYIQVPLEKHTQTTLIKDIKIKTNEDWRGLIMRQVEHYKKRSPFYKETIEVIKEGLNIETDSIVVLNKHSLSKVCSYLSIPFDCEILSEMPLLLPPIHSPGEWALRICEGLHATEYLNPPGGVEIFEAKAYEEAGIDLQFLNIELIPYSQRREVFEPGLSIIDVMMFNEPSVIRDMLDRFEISRKNDQ